MPELQEYIQLLQSIIRIPSFSGEEKGVADLLEGWMTEHGLTVRRKHNNIWVESEPESCGKPSILLNAHLDTVKPASDYTRDPFDTLGTACEDKGNGIIYGLGSNDDGGSLVALLAAYMKLAAAPQSYRLVFSATAEEENCGPTGIDTVIEDFGTIHTGIIGEPTGMRMALAEKGLIVLDCTATGKSGHAARNEGVNAIYEALKDIEWFKNYRFEKVSEFLGPVKMTVTIINAGTLHNVIPDSCRFTVDVRPNGEYSNQEIVDIIKEHVSCDVKPRSMKHNSSGISSDNPLVARGLKMGLETFGSPTTSNQTRCSFPTFKMGPGDSARSHKADEFIRVSEISEAIDIYFKLLNGLQL